MAILTRPVTSEDLELLLAIDRRHAERFGLELLVTRSALTHFERSGHSFVAERDRAPVGFVFAHAVWNGLHPVVTSQRLAAAGGDDDEVFAALLEALTKSAYDAAAYLVQVAVPGGHEKPRAVGRALGFAEGELVLLSRKLGSTAARGAGHG